MTFSRALRGVSRAVCVPVAALTALAVVLVAVVAPAITAGGSGTVHADDGVQAVEASPSPSSAVAPSPTTTEVASAAPVPGAAVGGAPRVGPLDAGVGNARGAGVWWLFGLGAAQVAILWVMTRRSRARLSPQDVAP